MVATTFTESLTVLEKYGEFAGAVAWIIVGFFAIRALMPYLLPYVTVLEGEAMIVERMSKYNRTITKGTHLVLPFFETLKPVVWSYNNRYDGPVSLETSRIMTRKTKLELMPFKTLTKDSEKVSVSMNIIFFIQDVKHVVYHGNNLYGTLQKLVQTRIREIVQQSLVENLTINSLQESIDSLLESDIQTFDKRGVSGMECKILDIKYPTVLTEKRELLEELEIQQDLQEKLYKQRSEMMQREMKDIVLFQREHGLNEDVLGKMLSSVIRLHHYNFQ